MPWLPAGVTGDQHRLEEGVAGVSPQSCRKSPFGSLVLSPIFRHIPTPMPRWPNCDQMFTGSPVRHPQIVCGLSVATRPDCLPEDVLDLLTECNKIKPVMIELGLQSIHPSTASYIRRGYDLPVYDKAVNVLHQRGIEVVTHVIAGLPGESKEDFLATVRHTAAVHSDGMKLQLLHVLQGTDLAVDYAAGKFRTLSMEEYLDWITDSLLILPPDMVIHRLTGDGPKNLLIAPAWRRDRKREVLNTLHRQLKRKESMARKGIYESWRMNPLPYTN